MKNIIKPKLLTQYRLLLEHVQEIIIIFNSKGKIIDFSSKAIEEIGYGKELFDIPIYEIFNQVFRYEKEKLIVDERFLKSPKESIVYRKNKTCFPVNLKVTVDNKNGKYIGICTVIKTSEIKEATREINNLKNDINNNNKISSERVAKVAHELRTPLNGIMGFANNLLDTKLEPNQLEAVNIITRCCNNMSSLINDLMDYAMISKKKFPMEQKEFSFNKFISQIVEFNNGSISHKGLKLFVFVSDDIPDKVIGDELRLTQVLNNLFSNAIKFTSIGQINLEVVKLSQTERNVELLFLLIDTGIGIDAEEKDKLFKSFSQIDNSLTRKYGGTGLGLSICKRMVEAMHGTIEVDSTKDKGSTFSFTVRLNLPMKLDEALLEPEEKHYVIDFYNSKKMMMENVQGRNEVSDLDYISRRLKGISQKEKKYSIGTSYQTAADMINLLEKLTLCIEMENWEKSEELAYKIKNSMPRIYKLSENMIFKLLFAVRKEDHDVALSILKEIKIGLDKES